MTAETHLFRPAPTLAQSSLYEESLRNLGTEVTRIPLRDTVAIGEARMIIRRFPVIGRVALVPGGPFWTAPCLSSARKQAALLALWPEARALGIRALIVNPASGADGAILRSLGGLPIITPQVEARIDLTHPKAERRATLHGKWRNRLRQAESMGLHLREEVFDARKHRWVLDLEKAQRATRGYRALPLDIPLMAAKLRPGQVKVFTLLRGAQNLAAMLFLLHDGAATYHIGVSHPEARATSAHHLLLWQAGCRLAEAGIRRIDLGPVETERDSGLARFKLGAGAVAAPRGPTLLFSPPTTALGRLAARISPEGARALRSRNDPSCR